MPRQQHTVHKETHLLDPALYSEEIHMPACTLHSNNLITTLTPMLELMRSTGIDNDHSTSAGHGELCSDSIHRRRKNENVEPSLVDDARQTAYLGGGRWMQSTSGSHAILSTLKRFGCRPRACR